MTWGQALDLYNKAKGDLTCVDPWAPFNDLAENPGEIGADMEQALARDEPFRVFQENIKFLPKGIDVHIFRGRSSDILPTLDRDSFDLIYIDGDHGYETVSSDIEMSRALIREGGIICGDDLELQAHECDATIARARPTLDLFLDEPSQTHYHPGVTLAVGENFGPASSWYGFWAMQKKEGRWLRVNLDGMPPHIPTHLPAQSLIGLKALLMEHGLL